MPNPNIDPRVLKYYGMLDEDRPVDPFGSASKLQNEYSQSDMQDKNATDPGMMGSQDKQAASDYFAMRDPQLGASFAKSGAQLGTLHGKVADTSSVQDFANAIGSQRERLSKINQNQQDAAQKRSSLRVDVLKYLNDKYDKQGNNADDRLQKYGEGQLKRNFDASQNDLDRQNKLSVATATNGKPTEAQRKYALYAKDAETANRDLEAGLATPGYDRSDSMQSFKDWVNPQSNTSIPAQQVKNAEINFANAISRGESGMNVTENEWARYEKLYFDRSGDSPEVRAQKARARHQKIMSLKTMGGSAFDTIPTAPEVPFKASPPQFLGEGAPKDQQRAPSAPSMINNSTNENKSSPKENDTREVDLGDGDSVREIFHNGKWDFLDIPIKGHK